MTNLGATQLWRMTPKSAIWLTIFPVKLPHYLKATIRPPEWQQDWPPCEHAPTDATSTKAAGQPSPGPRTLQVTVQYETMVYPMAPTGDQSAYLAWYL